MDIRLHYTEAGQGKPLILLHGNGEDHSYFFRQIPAFAEHYRVIAVDTRGHGASERGSAPFTIEQFGEDLGDFLDQLGIEKAHILGFSDGGNIAMAFALKHPERVEKLILNGANLDPSGVVPEVQIPFETRHRMLCRRKEPSAEILRERELLGLMVGQPNVKAEELRALTMPVLVLAGTEDLIREEHTRLIQKSLPKGQLVLLPGDHFIAAECPVQFNEAVLQFLKD